MVRRFLLNAAIALAGAAGGYGLYAWLISDPDPIIVAPPTFEDVSNSLPTSEQFAQLAQTDPIAMLRAALTRYQREVKGFRAVMEKQERISDDLHGTEVVKMSVREQPVAVSMRWLSGARSSLGSPTKAVLFVEGTNEDKIASWRPDALFMKESKIDVKGTFARDASRYNIKDAGFGPTLLRTFKAWEKNQKDGEFKFAYHGVQSVPQAGGRPCFVIERICPRREADSYALDEAATTDAKKLERDGFDLVTIMIDVETWIQVGSELKRANGDLIGSYYFRDVELNPTFAEDEFTMAGLKKSP